MKDEREERGGLLATMAARMQRVQKFKGILHLERNEATVQLLPRDESLLLVTIATVMEFIRLSLCDFPKKMQVCLAYVVFWSSHYNVNL